MKRYTVGVDFGSLSGRAIVLDTQTGDITNGIAWWWLMVLGVLALIIGILLGSIGKNKRK
jgi:hypothetical protein